MYIHNTSTCITSELHTVSAVSCLIEVIQRRPDHSFCERVRSRITELHSPSHTHTSHKQLVSDKDTLVSALNASHETHMLTLNKKEDFIMSHSHAEKNSLLQGLGERELARNREKVTEIRHYLQQQRYELGLTSVQPHN